MLSGSFMPTRIGSSSIFDHTCPKDTTLSSVIEGELVIPIITTTVLYIVIIATIISFECMILKILWIGEILVVWILPDSRDLRNIFHAVNIYNYDGKSKSILLPIMVHTFLFYLRLFVNVSIVSRHKLLGGGVS